MTTDHLGIVAIASWSPSSPHHRVKTFLSYVTRTASCCLPVRVIVGTLGLVALALDCRGLIFESRS